MNSYLDNMMNSNIVQRNDPYLYIEKPDYDDGDGDIFQYVEYDYSDGRMWINRHFLIYFSELFALSIKEAGDFIQKWFEKTFDVEVKFRE